MNNYYVLIVEGEIKEFNDIYEGMIPDVIGTREELIRNISKIFEINEWLNEEKSIEGISATTNIKISFIPDQDGSVRMLNVENIEKEQLNLLCKEHSLSILN